MERSISPIENWCIIFSQYNQWLGCRIRCSRTLHLRPPPLFKCASRSTTTFPSTPPRQNGQSTHRHVTKNYGSTHCGKSQAASLRSLRRNARTPRARTQAGSKGHRDDHQNQAMSSVPRRAKSSSNKETTIFTIVYFSPSFCERFCFCPISIVQFVFSAVDQRRILYIAHLYVYIGAPISSFARISGVLHHLFPHIRLPRSVGRGISVAKCGVLLPARRSVETMP